ncbi:hypothetical protein WR25_01285 [Diploscapter pachys]|uniref:Phosphate transporter n=1 Tax=Diploscapter pachys TaxID=2018661 RepID=A0A2A2J322_9BILA|nr:hypothetical protein WR25_01285 [Diploscapter pachys]
MDFLILRRRDPLKCAYRVLPIVYFLVFTFISFVVLYRGTKWLHFDQIGGWLALVIALGIGVAAGLVVQFVAKPYLVKWVDKHDAFTVNFTVNGAEPTGKPPEMQRSSVGIENGATTYRPQQFHLSPTGFVQWFLPDRKRKDDPKTLRLFSAIQIFSACFTGFSHGSKDIPNTIAPLANFVFVFNTVRIPKPVETPLWFLIYGSFATCIGFWLMGHKVIKRVGTEFTEINPYCGFVVELGAAITVVVASKLGIPISLSLCIVGSVMAVGAVRGSIPVNWSLFGKVFVGWVITFPLSGVFAAVFMAILKSIFIS